MAAVQAERKTFLLCGHCGNATVHTLLLSEEADFRHCDSDGFFCHEPATNHVFRCDGCMGISLYTWSAFHRPYSEFGERSYPYPVTEEPGIPAAVRVVYHEAEMVKRHSNSAYAVLARKVLEVIVRERGIADRNLSRAISVLAKRGDIPPLLAEAATLMRIFGNSGAHPSDKSINGIHVEMIEKFLAALIQYLYVAPASLRLFKYLLDIDSNDSISG